MLPLSAWLQATHSPSVYPSANVREHLPSHSDRCLINSKGEIHPFADSQRRTQKALAPYFEDFGEMQVVHIQRHSKRLRMQNPRLLLKSAEAVIKPLEEHSCCSGATAEVPLPFLTLKSCCLVPQPAHLCLLAIPHRHLSHLPQNRDLYF